MEALWVDEEINIYKKFCQKAHLFIGE